MIIKIKIYFNLIKKKTSNQLNIFVYLKQI